MRLTREGVSRLTNEILSNLDKLQLAHATEIAKLNAQIAAQKLKITMLSQEVNKLKTEKEQC